MRFGVWLYVSGRTEYMPSGPEGTRPTDRPVFKRYSNEISEIQFILNAALTLMMSNINDYPLPQPFKTS